MTQVVLAVTSDVSALFVAYFLNIQSQVSNLGVSLSKGLEVIRDFCLILRLLLHQHLVLA